MQAPPDYYGKVVMAHAICGCLAWVVFIPAGGIVIRALNHPAVLWIHVACQMIGYALFCITFGTGVWFEVLYGQVSDPHPIIGMILFGLATIQPFLGTIHHSRFQKVKRRTFLSILHVQLGRMLITVGMLNGGLGLMLAADSTPGEMQAYGIIAGIVWIAYIITSSFMEVKVVKKNIAESSETSSIAGGDLESATPDDKKS